MKLSVSSLSQALPDYCGIKRRKKIDRGACSQCTSEDIDEDRRNKAPLPEPAGPGLLSGGGWRDLRTSFLHVLGAASAARTDRGLSSRPPNDPPRHLLKERNSSRSPQRRGGTIPRTEIDFAFDRVPGQRTEPLHQRLRVGHIPSKGVKPNKKTARENSRSRDWSIFPS
jgi:hypothetical protein